MSGISKSQVSRLCTDIDERVHAFLDRSISTIKALRLPAPNTASLIYSLCRSNLLLHVRSQAAEISVRARSRSSRSTIGYFKLVVRRISQVPGESIPYLCPALGPRPVRLTSPSRSAVIVPAFGTTRTPALRPFRGSITRLRYPLPTLHEHVTMPYARLASGGWLILAGWESNPLDSIDEFPLSI
jgi:hypothetical protein